MIRLTIPEIGDEEIELVTSVLRSGYLVQGAHVAEFERSVADYVGVKHAVAVSSGTAALHLALLSLGIGPGDEVIVPDFTFPATANVVEVIGAKAVLVDIELGTFNIDPEKIRAAVSPRTKVIIPVHQFGLPADMDAVREIAHAYDLFIVEDAACALGAEYKGQKCGTMGDLGCFSFHPRKAITTGEGGMIVTNDDELAESLTRWRNHGMGSVEGWVRFGQVGLNYRLTDFQGALGVVQVRRLDQIISTRRNLVRVYQQLLAEFPGVVRPAEKERCRHIWQSYVVMLPPHANRDQAIIEMRKQGVETTIGTYSNSAQPYYADSGLGLPDSTYAFNHSLCLPLHTRLTPLDIGKVTQCLMNVL